MSDSYFDSDTELYSGKRSSQYNEFVVNDIESLDNCNFRRCLIPILTRIQSYIVVREVANITNS